MRKLRGSWVDLFSRIAMITQLMWATNVRVIITTWNRRKMSISLLCATTATTLLDFQAKNGWPLLHLCLKMKIQWPPWAYSLKSENLLPRLKVDTKRIMTRKSSMWTHLTSSMIVRTCSITRPFFNTLSWATTPLSKWPSVSSGKLYKTR